MFNFNKVLNIKYLLIFILIILLFYCVFNKFNIIEANKDPPEVNSDKQEDENKIYSDSLGIK
tara:strand:+ start:507 stop:692 length:186 start_codon:yes stop_codon:yes gene_type:complete